MAECRFDRRIYSGRAVDRAVKILADFAEFDLVEEEKTWVVRLRPHRAETERQLVGELQNHALGLTIESGARA